VPGPVIENAQCALVSSALYHCSLHFYLKSDKKNIDLLLVDSFFIEAEAEAEAEAAND
jgi:hypothetical protein